MELRAYPEYKPSGVEWLEEVPSRWDVKRLKYCVYLVNEKVDCSGLDLPYTGLEHIESWTGRRVSSNEPITSEGQSSRFCSGDVLFGKLRPYLAKVYRAIDDGICTGELLVLRPHLAVQKFLFYIMLSRDFISIVDSSTYGAKMPRASWEFIGNLPVLLPPEPEQRAIAAFLDRETARIDALISKKERQIELLQEKRTALISHVVTKGLNPNVKMKSSGIEWLGEIPEHWKIVPLKFAILPRGDAIKTGPFGSQLLSSEMVAGSVKVYNQRNVLDRDFLSGENYVTEGKYQELIAFTIFPGDILVTTRGTIGRCALFPANAQPGILHPCLMRIQANPQVVLPDYLPMLIQDGGIVLLQLKLMSNATTIDVIYSESLKSVRLPLPSTQEQQKILTWINREVTKHDKLVATVCESIEKLREYRTALISAAVTGKIDVREGCLT